MMDLRDLIPGGLIRHRNRCEPKPKRDGQIFAHDDGTVSIAYMTVEEATRVYHLTARSRHLYGMRYRLGEMLGLSEDEGMQA